jgi:hypothetical protein
MDSRKDHKMGEKGGMMSGAKSGKLITMDNKNERLAEADKKILEEAGCGGLIAITSNEQLMELAQAAGETKSIFDAMLKGMAQEQADFIRELRVDKGYTWRSVAQTCSENKLFEGGVYDWQPPSNQLAGMALCERAAKFFKDEQYMKEPWN